MIQVIALELGFDGSTIREPGALFEMPAEVYDRREKLNSEGEPTGRYYEPPHWFEPVDKKLKAAVEAERKEVRKQGRTAIPAVNAALQAALQDAAGKAMAEEQAKKP